MQHCLQGSSWLNQLEWKSLLSFSKDSDLAVDTIESSIHLESNGNFVDIELTLEAIFDKKRNAYFIQCHDAKDKSIFVDSDTREICEAMKTMHQRYERDILSATVDAWKKQTEWMELKQTDGGDNRCTWMLFVFGGHLALVESFCWSEEKVVGSVRQSPFLESFFVTNVVIAASTWDGIDTILNSLQEGQQRVKAKTKQAVPTQWSFYPVQSGKVQSETFAQAYHKRLGADSQAHVLDMDVMKMILQRVMNDVVQVDAKDLESFVIASVCMIKDDPQNPFLPPKSTKRDKPRWTPRDDSDDPDGDWP